MLFRPRIFISSTFSDNQDIRDKLKEYFESIGGEPLLYEYNLTPSSIPMTYRQNILESDFVILIMKNNYGTVTDSGISGTHEEYRIAKQNNIPIHIYLLHEDSSTSKDTSNKLIQKLEDSSDSKDTNKLIQEFKEDRVSYYYFKTEEELYKRLRETTFIIAREITLNQIINSKLDDTTINILAVNHDYKKAIELLSIFEKLKEINRKSDIDYIDTDIITGFFNPVFYEKQRLNNFFIDSALDITLDKISDIANEFSTQHAIDYVPNYRIPTFKFNVCSLFDVTVSYSEINNHTAYKEREFYESKLKELFEEINYFKLKILEKKIQVDIIR